MLIRESKRIEKSKEVCVREKEGQSNRVERGRDNQHTNVTIKLI